MEEKNEIERLKEENGKLKTLVYHFEQLERALSAEIQRLQRENAELKKKITEGVK